MVVVYVSNMELCCFEHGSRGIFIEKTAICQGTMMGGIGHCGSYQCLVAVTLPKC